MSFIIFTPAILLFIAAAVVWLQQKKKIKNNLVQKAMDKPLSEKNRLHIAHVLFTHLPFIKDYYKKIYTTVEMVYPADRNSINNKATKLMLSKLLIALVLGIGVVLVAGSDIFYLIIGIVSVLVVVDYSISKKLRDMEATVLRQLQTYLSDLRHYYMSSQDVVESIGDSIGDAPFELSLHIQKIYDIVSSQYMEEKLEQYKQTSPNRFFLLLASICSTTKEYGDSKTATGESAFINSLSYLKDEIGTELLKIQNSKHQFALLSEIAIAAVFFLKFCELYNMHMMPEIKDFYNSIYGKIALFGISAASFICYKVVEVLKEFRRGELIRDSVWNAITRIPVVKTITNKLVNKYYTKSLILEDNLKEIGDQTGPQAFIVKSAVFGLAAMLFTLSIFGTGTIRAKVTMLHNFVGNYDSTIVPSEKYVQNMQAVTNEYANMYKREQVNKLDVTVIAEDIQSNTMITNKAMANMIAESIVKELKEYHNTYFKFYYLIVAIFAFVIGAVIPYAILKIKIYVAGMNKVDEVNQFQTIVLILMNTEGITIDTILEWMDRFAYSFKASIEDCKLELEQGNNRAIEKMKNSEKFMPFKRFCDCLLEIDNVGISGAFEEVAGDRAYLLKERELQNNISIEKKSGYARMIAKVPAVLEFIFYLLLPMVLMALKMLTSSGLLQK